MKSIKFASILVFLIIFSLSCAFVTQPLLGGGGPKNFTAVLTAPDVVLLTWDAVEGATGYMLEVSLAGDEYFEAVNFAADQTTFTDYLVPEQTDVNYRLSVLTDSGAGGISQVSITTGEQIPNPLNVTPSVDEASKVTQVIGADGGSLTLVDSAGVDYTLEVPAGVIDADTIFSLTPLLNLEGWPLDGGILAGVKVEPEDIFMAEPATLTINLPDVPAEDGMITTGFASQVSGEDFYLRPVEMDGSPTSFKQNSFAHLAAPSRQAKGPRIIIVNPSGVTGVGRGSKASIANYAKKHSPKSKTGARSQKEVVMDTLEPLPKDLASTPLSYELAGIELSIQAAGDCRSLRSGILAFSMWQLKADRSTQPVPRRESREQKTWKELVDKTKEILDKTAEDCEKNKDKSNTKSVNCAKFIAKMLSGSSTTGFWKSFQNEMENSLGKNYIQDIKDKLDKCKKSYSVSGSLGDMTISGNLCDPLNPFTLNWKASGGNGKMEFAPSTDTGGNFVMTGTASGLAFNASGAYLIEVPEEGSSGTLKIFGSGTVAGSGGGEGSLSLAEIPTCSK